MVCGVFGCIRGLLFYGYCLRFDSVGVNYICLLLCGCGMSFGCLLDLRL